MPRIQSPTRRAYCRVDRPPAWPARRSEQKVARLSVGGADVVIDRLPGLFGHLEPHGHAGLLLAHRRAFIRLGRVRRAAEERGELLDPLHVVMLRFPCELADRHVFDHAPTQRADSLLGHGDAPVLMEVANPSSQDRTPRPAIALAPSLRSATTASALQRERFSPLTRSGSGTRFAALFVDY